MRDGTLGFSKLESLELFELAVVVLEILPGVIGNKISQIIK